MCVAALCCDAFGTSPSHAAGQTPNSVLWNPVPFFLQGLDKLLSVGWSRSPGIHLPPKLVPQMLDGIKVRRTRFPWHDVHILIVQEVSCESGSMWSGVVMLKGGNPWMRLQKGDEMGSQNLIHIALGVKVAVNDNELCPELSADTCPYHYSRTTPAAELLDAGLRVPLPSSSPYPLSAICY